MGHPDFSIQFAPEVLRHLGVIPRQHHGLLRTVIHEQLSHVPLAPTRNRKQLLQPAPFGATWELRCGPRNRFRVFYVVDEDTKMVSGLAIGVKLAARLLVGGEEYRP